MSAENCDASSGTIICLAAPGIPKCPSRARQTRHDGANRQICDIRNLTIRELFEFAQNQYWAKRWSKSSCTIMPSPNFRERSRFPGHSGAFDSNLGNAYAVSGRREEAIKIIKDLESRHDQNPSLDADIALVYVGLGDQDQAISWLNKGYEARFKASILLHPAFDPLRSDARFKELMRRVGLPG